MEALPVLPEFCPADDEWCDPLLDEAGGRLTSSSAARPTPPLALLLECRLLLWCTPPPAPSSSKPSSSYGSADLGAQTGNHTHASLGV